MTYVGFLFIKREIKAEEKTHCGVSYDFPSFFEIFAAVKEVRKKFIFDCRHSSCYATCLKFSSFGLKQCASVRHPTNTLDNLSFKKILLNFSIERRGKSMVKQTVARSLIVWALLQLLHNATSIQEGRLLSTV